MKKFVFVALLLITHHSSLIPLHAQRHPGTNFLGVTMGGGLQSWNYTLEQGERTAGIGYTLGLHMAYFFDPQFGINFGMRWAWTHSSATYNFSETTEGLVHPDNPGVTYDLTTTFDHWKERQSVNVVSFPVELLWRTRINRQQFFYAGLGFQLDLPIRGSYTIEEGSYTTSGYFPATGHTVVGQPQHGFANGEEGQEGPVKALNLGVSLIADLGVRWNLGGKGVYLGLYASYTLNDMVSGTDRPLLELNTDNSSGIHYNGTFGSREVGSVSLLCVGLKVGVDLGD